MKAKLITVIFLLIAAIACREQVTPTIDPPPVVVVPKPADSTIIITPPPVVPPADPAKKKDSVEVLGPEFVRIPDVNFEQKLIDLGIDSDNKVNGRLLRADAEKVDTLRTRGLIQGPGKISLKGIEAFTNLVYLECSTGGYLDSLDVSKNTKLEFLNCSGISSGGGIYYNVRSYLKLNKNLKYLNANLTSFSTLEGGLPKTLEELYYANIRYNKIDVSHCRDLETLILQRYAPSWYYEVCVYGQEQIKDNWTKQDYFTYKVCE